MIYQCSAYEPSNELNKKRINYIKKLSSFSAASKLVFVRDCRAPKVQYDRVLKPKV